MRRVAERTSSSGTPPSARSTRPPAAPRSAAAPPRGRPRGRPASSRARSPSCTSTPIIAASSQASVPGFTWRWMSASSAVSERRGSITIRQRAGSLGDLLQGDAGAGDAVGEPGILAEEERHLAVLEVGARVAAHHLRGDPELAGLLLREGVRAVHRAEHGAGRAAVRARQVVALAAAAVVEDRLRRRARRAPRRSAPPPRGSPCPSRSPRSCRPARRRSGCVSRCGPVLVEVEARGLLAGVALRRRMRVVAAHPDEAAAVLAAELDLDPPPSWISTPQLHSHRMQAVGCQSVDSRAGALAAVMKCSSGRARREPWTGAESIRVAREAPPSSRGPRPAAGPSAAATCAPSRDRAPPPRP